MAGEHAMNARRSRVGKAPDEHATCGMSGRGPRTIKAAVERLLVMELSVRRDFDRWFTTFLFDDIELAVQVVA